MRTAFLSGNLGRDAEVRTTTTEYTILEFSLANSDEYKKTDAGSYEHTTSWFDVKFFTKDVQKWTSRLKKGAHVVVQCDIKQETWQTQDGQNRSKIVFYVARGTYPVVVQQADTAPAPTTPQAGGTPEWMY